MEALSIITIENPFDRTSGATRLVDPKGLSLDQIVDLYAPQNVPVVVSVNGRAIHTDNYKKTFPEDGDEIILSPMLHGGSGSSGKQILRIVLLVALVFVANFAAAGFWLGGGNIALGGTALWGAGVMLVGGILINILVPPVLPSMAAPTNDGFDNSQNYNWNPVLTQRQGLVLPKWYGLNRIRSGNIIAGLVETVGYDQFYNALINYGYGPWQSFTDFRINEQDTDLLNDINIHTRLGFINQLVIPFFDDTAVAYSVSVKVTSAGGPVIFETVGDDFDKLNVEISFPGGLWEVNTETGKLINNVVQVKVEVKRDGAQQWVNISQTGSNLFNPIVEDRVWSLGYVDPNSGSRIEVRRGSQNRLDHYIGEVSKTDSVSVIVDTAEDDQMSDVMRIRPTWSWLTLDVPIYFDEINFRNFAGSNTRAIRYSFVSHSGLVKKGYKYKVRVTKLTTDRDNSNFGDVLWLSKVSEINTTNFTYPRQVLVGVNALATDQLSGALRVDFEAETSVIRSYTTTSEVTTIATGAELGPQQLNIANLTEGDAGTSLTVFNANVELKNDDSTAAFADGDFVAVSTTRYLITGNVDLAGTNFSFGGASSGSLSTGDFSLELVAVNANILVLSNGSNNGINDVSNWTILSVKEVEPTQVPDWEIGYSNNPAWVCYDTLTQPVITGLPQTFAANDAGNSLMDIGSILVTSTAAAPNVSKTSISFSGAQNTLLSVRLKKSPTGTWDGTAFYKTSGHDFQVGFHKTIPEPTWNADDWATIQFDMTALTAGGTDWVDSTIIGVLFSFYQTHPSVVEIDYIHLRALFYAFRTDAEGWVGANVTIDPEAVPYWRPVGTFSTKQILAFQGQETTLHLVTTAANSGVKQDLWTLDVEYGVSAKLWIVSGEIYIGSVGEKVGGGNFTETGKWLDIFELHVPTTDTEMLIAGVSSGADFYIAYEVSEERSASTYAVDRYIGFQPSQIDFAKFKEWADHCDELLDDGEGGTAKRYTFNGGFDSETTLWDAALSVCAVAQAMLLWNGAKVSLFIDKASEPVQLFSIGNIVEDSFKETFVPKADKVTELEIDFINKNKDYTRDKFTIINPDVDFSTNKTTLNLKGITSSREAWRLGMYKLKQSELLVRIISWRVEIDAIACQIGDVVNLQHNVPIWGEGGRVVSNTTTTVTLDQEVTLLAGKIYDLVIRDNDDTLITRELINAAGDWTTVSFTSAISGDVSEAPYAVGEQTISVKPVRLINLERNQDMQITLTAVDYNASIYNIDTDTPVLPNYQYSALFDRTLLVSNITLLDRLVNIRGIVQTDLEINFEYDVNVVKQVDIYYKLDEGAGYSYLATTTTGSYTWENVQDGQTYSFLFAATDYAGWSPHRSKWPGGSHLVVGKIADPGPLLNLNLDVIDKMANFNWTLPVELDVQVGGVIEVRHTAKVGGVTWNDGFALGSVTGTESGIKGLPLVEGTYIFRVKDSTNHVSTLVTLETGTIPTMLKFNALTNLIEDDTFLGVKTNMGVGNNVLSLSLLNPEPRVTSSGDVRVTSGGNSRVALTLAFVGTGSYEFDANYFDLGSVQESRVTAELIATVYNLTDTIDSRLTLIDTWDSFDGPSVTGITYEMFIRTTEDDPGSSPTWTDWRLFYIGDYLARAFEFKLEVTNTDQSINIDISTLRVKIDMPDRLESGVTIDSTAAGITITFAVPFKSTPAIGIAPLDMATGDYFTITSRTSLSYFVRFFNSSDTGIARDFDWMAKGF